jgi:hypothetical protein
LPFRLILVDFSGHAIRSLGRKEEGMVWVPDWLKPRARRVVGVGAQISDEASNSTAAEIYASATNAGRQVIEIVRPHLATGSCLIVTGYQDFFSSLSIILAEIPEISTRDGGCIRIAFGVDTNNAPGFSGRGRTVGQVVKDHFLSQRGLAVEDAADLKAVLAADAIRSGAIDLRVFDPSLAQEVMGVSGGRRLHAKIVTSELGSITGSANFSRAGLYHNIEFADDFSEEGPDGPAQEAAKERRTAAELIWSSSVDWNAEALEILEALLRPVCPEDAMARLLHEQTSFRPWSMNHLADVVGRNPFAHQVDLVYEASHIAYEHGFAFVESPTGSGKTEIGKHLGWTLARTFEAAVGADHTGQLPRGGAMVIAPPKVIKNWKDKAPRTLTAVANTRVASRKKTGAEEEVEPAHRIDQYGVVIIDESHTMTPGFEESSKRAEAIEFAPPSWNICLSATLLGNKDVDWLAHMQEKRASIFMSPSYLEEMKALFERETDLTRMMEGQSTADALSGDAREALSNMLSPFLAHRQRACVGESADRTPVADKASYPPFVLHPRPKALSLSPRQAATVDEIVQLTSELAPGRRVTSVTTSRFGTKAERRHNQNSLYARNLLNVLRANSAQAVWEMEHGAIGRQLRKFEREERRKAGFDNPLQGDLFAAAGDPLEDAPTPKCDALQDLLGRAEVQRIDERRYAEALKIQKAHRRVVFLAERVDTLQIFAEELARRSAADGSAHTNFVASSDPSSNGGPTKEEARRAVGAICGGEERHFRQIKDGDKIEAHFRPGGERAPDGDASIFLTYQMAEGINLQSADALVLLGVTSNLKELIQGLGRIDRIDSKHSLIHYYLIDIPVARIASDEKVAQRLENYRALSGRERLEAATEVEGDTQVILEGVAAYLREPRALRANNFHDVLSEIRGWVDPARYDTIAGLQISGLWGAELALLDGAEAFTVLHLRGEDGHGQRRGAFAPPRLVMIDAAGEVERNQILCAQSLRRAYRETLDQGLETAAPDASRIMAALEALSSRIDGLKDWDLRPERTVSLLQSLSVFLGEPETDAPVADLGMEAAADEEMFGDISLQGLEYLAETWARFLDPYWVIAKQKVRERFASAESQSYISIAEIMRHLDEDLLEREKIRGTMRSALEAARGMGLKTQVSERIAVAFVSPGRMLN